MATVSAAPLHRPKKLVRYGKASSRSTWGSRNGSSWLGDDEDEPAAMSPVSDRRAAMESRVPRKATIDGLVEKAPLEQARGSEMDVKPAEPPVRQRPIKPDLSRTMAPVAQRVVKQPAQERAPTSASRFSKKRDAFDVPSSDDEDTEVPLRRILPSRTPLAKRNLVAETPSADAPLATWEKAKLSPDSRLQPRGQVRSKEALRSDAVLDDGARHLAPRKELVRSPRQDGVRGSSDTVSNAMEASQALSAAARLALRRQQASSNARPVPVTSEAGRSNAPSNKRVGSPADVASLATGKRARKSPPNDADQGQLPAVGTFVDPVCEAPPPTVNSTMDLDIYDVPADDVYVAPIKPNTTADDAKARRARRSKVSSASILTPKKGISAPARLTDMLPPDTNGTETRPHSHIASRSKQSTPRRTATPTVAFPPATSPTAEISSPRTATKAAGTLTPRQAHLWSQLLPSDPPAPTPSSLAIRELTLSGRARTGVGDTRPRTLFKSSSDVPEMHRRRTRLVDRLKASAPTSENVSSEEDSDAEMEDADSLVQQVPLRHADDASTQLVHSQPQIQSTTTDSGPQITYSRTRSYLPEDTLEANLLLDLPSFTPRQPISLSREPSKTTLATQKSALDLDGSDEEGAASGRMRTIHELRAAGRHNRFVQETEGLLEDIADHDASGRSRRRGALVELGTKCMEKAYVEKFVALGFETKILAEVAAERDGVADFVLAGVFAVLLAAEPPEHTVRSLKQSGLLAWLVGLLHVEVDVGTMAKERKNNMSKAAQGTLVDFAKAVQMHTALWGDLRPTTVTPRLLALKAMDLLVGRLRRSGDKTELLDAAQLDAVLPHTGSASTGPVADLGVAISLLEALSTSALQLAWPAPLLERLVVLLPTLSDSPDIPPHTVFLALRLTLNLTNDNAPTCDLFARPETVEYLLTTVQTGFATLDQPDNDTVPDDQRSLSYDLLILALASCVNLAEHSASFRLLTLQSSATLTSLLTTFIDSQALLATADSLDQSSTNVALGYLAVMLANLCQCASARAFVEARLPNGDLGVLVEAVAEFVRQHERVDGLGFEGEEGSGVWGGFTEKLRAVLGRVRAVADADAEEA
ncbi:hypothetical protein LTR53_012463 [Teratosphaeriaceae sp. CCFEE 6253]|nr:hypothetical protein LTR53_012463 [Teratosphaeriaceae sp. CCFEE 6253]